ncbi:MAG: T9SS type A sorting domain-containing protein [Flavobacteriaceae bacterium]|nr:T9SS type A sorting domain-containing protein [Flavobacteriaceae bacterium]
MKKHLHFYGVLFLMLAIALLVISFSNGGSSSNGVTGSPLDNQLAPQSCLTCHDNNGNFNTAVSITSDIPSGGYALGQTYNMTVTQTANGASKHGFQITVENNAPSKIGGFVVTDVVNTHLQAGGNFVTHSLAGSDQNSWNFAWTAPSIDVGAITFYVASIAGNLNSSGGATTSSNQMAQNTMVIGSVLATNKLHLLHNMYPNPGSRQVTLQLPSQVNSANVTVFNYLGKSFIQKTINSLHNTIDVSSLSTGIYFVRIQTDSQIGTKKLFVR